MREINEIPAEKFRFVGPDCQPPCHPEQAKRAEGSSHHRWCQDPSTPPWVAQDDRAVGVSVGYFREAFGRFRKNKSSVVAAVIILCLVAYAVFVPIFCQTPYSVALTDTTYLQYTKLKPRNRLFVKWGISAWDGCSVETLGRGNYLYLQGISEETGRPVIQKLLSESTDSDGNLQYKCRVDSYTARGFAYMTLTESQYRDIQAWQTANNLQVIYPAVEGQTDANVWYKANKKGVPLLDGQGNYVNQYKTTGNDGGYDSLRIPGDSGQYRYAAVTGDGSSYRCRVFLHSYFQYRYGFEPSFLLGTTGQDRISSPGWQVLPGSA